MTRLNFNPKSILERLTLPLSKRIFFSIVLCLVISGCARVERGASFNPSNINQLSIGKTSKDDFVALFGTSTRTNLFERNGKRVEILMRQYGQITTTTNMKYRSLTGEFIDNVLNGYIFQSGFESDSTNFDESKRLSLKTSETSEKEILNMFGKPSGVIRLPTMLNISPLTASIFDEGEVWIYWYPEFISKSSEDYREKKLLLKFDEQKILADIAYKSDY